MLTQIKGIIMTESREIKVPHWSEQLARRVIGEKKAPIVVTGGMTTSGPAHLGTVCEFLYPTVIKRSIEALGSRAEMHFVGDIMDALDSVPAELKNYTNVLTPELGKPLAYALDPLGCHKSFGEHYLSEAEDIMKALKLDVDVVRADFLYQSGAMDDFARLYLHEEQKVKEIVAKSSLKDLSSMANWSPIMPICEKCGKVATTTVVWHNDEEYEYVCDRDVGYTKGCGFRGRNKISDHRYKLQWRVYWPAWMVHFKTSIEGSGVDHMTHGGSADTAIAMLKEILHHEPPILFKYGFVLFKGKKASKSAGNAASAKDILKLIPPEVLVYILVLPYLTQNKDIDPSGEKLMQVYDDLERVAKLENPESRADEKKVMAYRLSVGKLAWKAPFVDILTSYQVRRDWKKVGEELHDTQGVAYLAPYIEEWLRQGYVPDRYDFSIKPTRLTEHKEEVSEFAAKLSADMDDITIHNLVYSVAKLSGIPAPELFKAIYAALIGKDNGPRLGKLIYFIGADKAKHMLEDAVK
ncbi:MAG: lysine--tRNA ligase [Candidatus Micrarchaeia archaeon]